jgi:hypothetical protein
MYSIQYITKKSNSLYLKVRMQIEEAKGQVSLQAMKSAIETGLSKVKTGNAVRADIFYKVRIVNEWEPREALEVYYVPNGDKAEQIIARVIKL